MYGSEKDASTMMDDLHLVIEQFNIPIQSHRTFIDSERPNEKV